MYAASPVPAFGRIFLDGERRKINSVLKFTVSQSFWVTWRDVVFRHHRWL